MKVLLDSCICGRGRVELDAAGHDVVWVGDWPQDPGDDEILARAGDEGRILVTLDKDFGELAVLYGERHCGILRLVDSAGDKAADVLASAGVARPRACRRRDHYCRAGAAPNPRSLMCTDDAFTSSTDGLRPVGPSASVSVPVCPGQRPGWPGRTMIPQGPTDRHPPIQSHT